MAMATVPSVEALRRQIDELVAQHPVVAENRYTRWFAEGRATRGEVRHLAVQFSVFSHLFVEAQLRKVINAADLDTYRAGKEILLNELGVVFNAGGRRTPAAAGTDPDLVATEGTVDGGRFRFGAAHFEWLLRFARPLDLGFDDLRDIKLRGDVISAKAVDRYGRPVIVSVDPYSGEIVDVIRR